MKMTIYLFFLFIIFMYACSSSKEDQVNAIRSLDTQNDSLSLVNIRLKASNDSFYIKVLQKLRNEDNSPEARFWLVKVVYLHNYPSDEIHRHLETFRTQLDGDTSLNNADSLYLRLTNYKEKILLIDQSIADKISNDVEGITYCFDSIKKVSTANLKSVFSKTIKEEQVNILYQTKARIEAVENKFLFLCMDKVK
ncbi:hypothetical protein [Parasediminibacterium sp. JCM 36343]|uniref:hypothetical protein n=1 Tax=Parasediminibacterium sp. JCM 36343 TaxID=3374279 RepID=UPI00397C85E0